MEPGLPVELSRVAVAVTGEVGRSVTHILSSALLKSLLVGKTLVAKEQIQLLLFDRPAIHLTARVLHTVPQGAVGGFVGTSTKVCLLPRVNGNDYRENSKRLAQGQGWMVTLRKWLATEGSRTCLLSTENQSNESLFGGFLRISDDTGFRSLIVLAKDFERRRLMLRTATDSDGYLSAFMYYMEMAEDLAPCSVLLSGVEEIGNWSDSDCFLTALQVVIDVIDSIRCTLVLEFRKSGKGSGRAKHRLSEILGFEIEATSSPVTDDIDGCIPESRKGTKLSAAVRLERFPGQVIAKEDLFDHIVRPLTDPSVYKQFEGFLGCRHARNLLLVGPPGTGKTMLARWVAASLNLAFTSIDATMLASSDTGGAERLLADLFSTSKYTQRTLIFIDEIDSLFFGDRSSNGSGKLISALFYELDSVSNGRSNIAAVLGATNNPWALDRALLRPGRFDHCVLVGLPETVTERKEILDFVLRDVRCAPDLKKGLNEISTRTAGFSGADLAGICRRAAALSFEVHSKSSNMAPGKSDAGWSLTLAEVNDALAVSQRSVQPETVESLSQWWRDRKT